MCSSATPGKRLGAARSEDLSIAPGEKLALVGQNGAGKTTLIKLLTHLYGQTEGQVLLDGVDLREYDPDSHAQAYWRNLSGLRALPAERQGEYRLRPDRPAR
ncbi:MAG: ATP-binding cassette domain-containing protein [Kouleothrix sp.]